MDLDLDLKAHVEELAQYLEAQGYLLRGHQDLQSVEAALLSIPDTHTVLSISA